jgi:hypothetical protein
MFSRDDQREMYRQIIGERDRWMAARTARGDEAKWDLARRLYKGEDEYANAFVETLASGPQPRGLANEQGPRSKIVVNIVRPKCDQAIARICEILLPVDDKCWGIKNTPVPKTINDMLNNHEETVIPGSNPPQGSGFTAHEEANYYLDALEDSRKRMEAAIDDPLTECNYNAEQRKVIEDAVVLGIGIMEGPYLRKRTSKVWQVRGEQAIMVESDSIVPASRRRDPYDVWFDPSAGNDHQRGAGVWDRRFVTRRELRDLIGVPGYDEDAIKAVLATQPTRAQVAKGRVERLSTSDVSYELYTYHGYIEPSMYECCTQYAVKGDASAGEDESDDVEFAVLMFVNDVCIGAVESWIPDKSLPFDVTNWRKSDESPSGVGLPHEMEHQQRVVIAAWRQIMNHARTISGNQLILKKGAVQPQDRQYQLTPDKVWFALDDVEDVNKVFTSVSFPSHLPDLMAIAKAAMEFVDHETSMPQLLSGDRGNAPETVGGMVLLFQNAHVVLRARMKKYDDEITRPHITRYYDFLMATSDDPYIKGDFAIDARGATALLERDISNQAALNLAALTSNPRYQPYLDPGRELDVILKAMKIMPQDVKLSAEQVQRNLQNPPAVPPDPRVQAAQIQAQAKQMELQDAKEQRQADMAMHADDLHMKAASLHYNQQREQAEWELANSQMELNRDTAILRDSRQAQAQAEAIAAKERMNSLNLDTKRQLFNAEANLKLKTGQGI